MGEEIPELYCRVFVNTDCTAEALSRVVREVLGGDGHGERIRIGLSAVDIQANGACDAERWSEPQTGFLYYRNGPESPPAQAAVFYPHFARIGGKRSG